MGWSVIRHDPMRRLFPLVAALWACAGPMPEPKLCDLNEIIPIYGRFGWNEERTAVVELPVEPVMISCTCEIDPGLVSFVGRNPLSDAVAAINSGDPHFWGLPKLGTVVPGFSIDLESVEHFPDIPTRQIPGSDEHSSCFERERLELAAEDYAVAYNTHLLELVLEGR